MTERWRKIARWAALGALSGTLATLAIFIPQWLNFYDALEGSLRAGGVDLSLSPLSLAPGLVFGLVVGHALRREGLMSGVRYAAYIVAAGLSYFVTVQITLTILIDMLDNVILIGVAAGAIGAALLAGATAALIPDFQHRRPMIAMTLAGAVLGAALFFAISSEHFFGWFLLFAPWQGGYAAAMATALEA
ncbi:MAG: hypothetical protein IMF08_13205 [Proteobacteria bacterium]|nr:hypothetical protein [Pseudomonadota bacterium]